MNEQAMGDRMRGLTRLWRTSVFHPVDLRRVSPAEVLVLLFHRTAASSYALVAVWGLISVFRGQPTITLLFPGEQPLYSALVFIAAGAAAVGASFFPHTARLEMYSVSSLLVLLIVYVAVIFGHVFLTGDTGRESLLIWSLLPFPMAVSRGMFVYMSLVEQARRNQRK